MHIINSDLIILQLSLDLCILEGGGKVPVHLTIFLQKAHVQTQVKTATNISSVPLSFLYEHFPLK